MTPTDFITQYTNRQLGPGGYDTLGFRSKLLQRFQTIHESVVCAHSPGEALLLADAVLRSELPHPVVECGCFQGGMTSKLSIVCQATGRELIVCDSFRGLPQPTFFGGNYAHFESRLDVVEEFGSMANFEQGQYAGKLEDVKETVRQHGNIQTCEFIDGYFEDTLPALSIAPALVTIDVDLIESARECLKCFWPQLQGKYLFTHEAFNRTYMEGILDPTWWAAEMNEPVPDVLGVATGMNAEATCTAILIKDTK